MEDININTKKWKYIDKKFCSEVLELADKSAYEDNSEEYPNLTKLVERVEAMKSDVCKSNCPSKFKNCKCYRSQILTPDKTNDVFCAMIQDGFAFACPESCCTNGAGCSEPDRRGEDVGEYEQIPEGDLIDLEDVVDLTDSGKLSQEAIVGIIVGVLFFAGFMGLFINSRSKSK
tara:strand:- start:434 stop:955 length:522 start_codon:yes stop_codon:yes gene_type:complete